MPWQEINQSLAEAGYTLNSFEREAELKPLQDALEHVEMQAGIAEKMARVREGSIFPLGFDGSDVTPAEFFADEEDFLRRGTRRVYFSVSDLYFRKQLITAARAIDEVWRGHARQDLMEARLEVAKAKAATGKLPWTKAAIISVGIVALGYQIFGIVGALAGTVGGFFVACGTVHATKNKLSAQLEEAETKFKELENSDRNAELFNQEEELSGESSSNFGRAEDSAKRAQLSDLVKSALRTPPEG